MDFCIPIEPRAEGGMYSFLETFRAYLDEHGIRHTRDIDAPFDILFVNAWVVPYRLVREVKERRPGVRVVHRVDGSARDYGRAGDADARQARVNLLADLTIFQSEYSRYSSRLKFRVIANDGPVIYNPVDLRRFTPDGPALLSRKGGPTRIVSAAWSTNPRKGTWHLNDLARQRPDLEFLLCGRFEGISSRPNVRLLGVLDRDRMAAALRSGDVFLNLSENDPCPNVVLEALASGLPVLYRNSGGVPELVGSSGIEITAETFSDGLARVLASRDALARAARGRAESNFASNQICPQYLDAIARSRRRDPPSSRSVLETAADGYAVLPLPEPVRSSAARIIRGGLALWPRSRAHSADVRVGWITYDSYPVRKREFHQLEPSTRMRAGNVGAWINAHSRTFRTELVRVGERYDIVIFQKMMDERCQADAALVQSRGGKVVFDANINYYEIWGDYFVPGTRPTDVQRHDAFAMTRLADWVVADSSYLADIIRKVTPRVTRVADNVNMNVYRGERIPQVGRRVTAIWSGIAKKSLHLELLADVLPAIPNINLVLVSDQKPDVLSRLGPRVPVTWMRFTERRYARALLAADVIVSPKRLINGYELGHTEYKITLGMAVGLPAVASPQQAYVEAIHAHGGGIIADTVDEWRDAIGRIAESATLRADLGARARRTVLERYSTPVVASQYVQVLERLSGASAELSTAPAADLAHTT